MADEDMSALERARRDLYSPKASKKDGRAAYAPASRETRHAWEDDPLANVHGRGKRHVRVAAYFFAGAFVFFLAALAVAAYFLYFGGNAVSVNNVDIAIQGPTSIAGGDTVPLSLSVTNRNNVPIENATLEIDFPDGTRDATDITKPYPRYTEDIGSIGSGQTVNVSAKAALFGAAGDSITLPVSLSYTAAGSNAVFVKKDSYTLSISSTPLSLSVDTLAETVSGKPLTLTLTVRSNATVPLSNVVVAASALPFGFTVSSSSAPFLNNAFLLGTMKPGDAKTLMLTGQLSGQDRDQRAFQFTVGTAKGPGDSNIAISYMTQSAQVTIAAPFIQTSLALNGSSATNLVIAANTRQSAALSYTNTLSSAITNARIAVQLSGSSVDYASVQTTNGFYDSSTHTVVFDPSTDPSLSSLAPGATGLGTFSFATLPSSSRTLSPSVTFSVSVSGTRVGQSNVPEAVNASSVQTAKVTSNVALSAYAFHTSGPFANTGPIPPKVDTPTTYSIQWILTGQGSAIAGASVNAILPTYVTFTGKTSGSGSITYDPGSRRVTWTAGDLAQGGSAQAAFQVSVTPSTSQVGSAPVLIGGSGLTAYDRFAGVQITSSADPVTTETKQDPGYVPTDSTVVQ